MNWYLVTIDKHQNNKMEDLNIIDLINSEYKKKKLYDKKIEYMNLTGSYASNQKIPIEITFEFQKIIIIGDISIHNKDEILENYNIPNFSGDFDIINEIYEKKGVEAIKDIVGEFSFIILEKETNKIFFIRDHIGIKTLFWIELRDKYIVSSDIFLMKKYFSLKDINNNYFIDFYNSGGIIDTERTPYKNLNRLPSGSYIQILDDSIKTVKYWDLINVDNISLKLSDEEYINNFLEIFSKSIESRMDSIIPNSVLLSGGLDSTSIYAIANEKSWDNKSYKINSYSAIFEELKECDEKEYIDELLNQYQKKGNYINYDNKLMYEEFPLNIPFSYEPNVNALSFEFTNPLVKASVDDGYQNILTGFGGDQLFTASLYNTRDYLFEKKYKKAFKELTEYSILTNTSAFKSLIRYWISPSITQHFLKGKKSDYSYSIEKKLKNIKTFNKKELYYQINKSKAHLFLDRVIGAINGADIKHPFLDRRVIEYIYQIPGSVRFNPYMAKIFLRESMKDKLPENIINKVNKTNHLAYTYRSVRENWNYITESLENPTIVKELGLITIDHWHESLNRWRNGLETSNDFWILLGIEIWFLKLKERVENV